MSFKKHFSYLGRASNAATLAEEQGTLLHHSTIKLLWYMKLNLKIL
jgi:hypothetical protein